MNYSQSMTYMTEKNSLGIIPGLDHILAVLSELGHPERAVPALQIAGTNGKGSIMAFVEQVLCLAGLKVGRYISPAISEYRERWTVNRRMPEEERVADLISAVRRAEESTGIRLTAFEAETAAAFLLFREEGCDLQLVECGMGGRLDATNVFPAKVVDILASVSLDHMQYLGDTREKILLEKLGILKKGDVLVSAPLDRDLRKVMADRGISCREADPGALVVESMDDSGTVFRYKGQDYRIKLVGETALENALTAIEALQAYNLRAEGFGLPRVSLDLIREGLEKTSWPGRFTVVQRKPTVILDGAHNRDAWKRLAGTIKRFYPDRRILLVTGVLRDKETKLLAETMGPLSRRVITFTPDSPRAMRGEDLAELFRAVEDRTKADAGKAYGVRADDGIEDRTKADAATADRRMEGQEEPLRVSTADSPTGALAMAIEEAGEEDVILAFGSLTFLGELLRVK